jgi:hypothetical protein
MSNEFFTVVDGVKTDEPMHRDILDNPEADLATATITARKAVAGGTKESTARELYGIPDTVPLTVTEAITFYEDRFQDLFPYRQFTNEEDALAAIEVALKTGEEVKTPDIRFTT